MMSGPQLFRRALQPALAAQLSPAMMGQVAAAFKHTAAENVAGPENLGPQPVGPKSAASKTAADWPLGDAASQYPGSSSRTAGAEAARPASAGAEAMGQSAEQPRGSTQPMQGGAPSQDVSAQVADAARSAAAAAASAADAAACMAQAMSSHMSSTAAAGGGGGGASSSAGQQGGTDRVAGSARAAEATEPPTGMRTASATGAEPAPGSEKEGASGMRTAAATPGSQPDLGGRTPDPSGDEINAMSGQRPRQFVDKVDPVAPSELQESNVSAQKLDKDTPGLNAQDSGYMAGS